MPRWPFEKSGTYVDHIIDDKVYRYNRKEYIEVLQRLVKTRVFYCQISLLDIAKITILMVCSRNMDILSKF